ncbi:MAG: ABC transporter ATP-binding protein [Betaproteobacteria bacterium]|nr:ABC transporter ATP-binding protein [Betaproteobacteria bacterium]
MSSEPGAAIRLAGLGKRYEIYDRPHHRLLQTLLRGRRSFHRDFWALSDVSFEVRRGETVGIVGRNGSGKSTLLELVAGTLAPTTGGVRTHGRVAALLELGSGFDPEFTGRQNVYLNGSILGIPRREMDERIGAIEQFAGIGAFIDQPVKTYSSGMTVRLAFAVAAHATPDVLLVDEALAVGDTAFQQKCLSRVREMQRAGVAILLVSHSPNMVIEFCDRAAYLEAGRLKMLGPCREVLEQYGNDVVSAEGGVALSAAPPAPSPEVAPAASVAAETQPATEILSVRITDAAGAEKACFSHGEEVVVRFAVRFHRANPAPCFGIQLRSVDDIALWASTTAYMDRRLPPAAAGTTRECRWHLRADCGGSRYVLALGAGDAAGGEYLRHHRLNYAGHFDVLPRSHGGTGWLEPSARFEAAA